MENHRNEKYLENTADIACISPFLYKDKMIYALSGLTVTAENLMFSKTHIQIDTRIWQTNWKQSGALKYQKVYSLSSNFHDRSKLILFTI